MKATVTFDILEEEIELFKDILIFLQRKLTLRVIVVQRREQSITC